MTTSGGSVWDRDVPEAEPPREPEASSAEPSATPDTGGTPEPLGSWEAPEPGSTHDSVWTRGPSIDATDAIGSGLAGEPAGDRTSSSRPEPVLPRATPPAPSRRRVIRRVRRPVALVVGVAAVVVVGVLAWSFGLVGGDEAADPAVAGDSSVAPAPVSATTLVPSTVPVTVPPTTVAPTTVAPTTVAPTTVAPTTVAPTTVAPTTVAPTTVPVAGGPQVVVVGRIAPCKFGPSCLVADFSIIAFETPQREFVCEFEDGGRYTFRFDGSGATDACATSAVDGTITIEVGGVRSETVTR